MARAAVCCILLVCAAVMESGNGLPSFYNFSIANKHNETGKKFIEIHLNHKEGQIWDLEISQSAGGTAPKLIPHSTDFSGVGYELIPGLGFYKIHTEKKSWALSKKICEQEGTHLMVINSEEEVESLNNFINSTSSCGNNKFWLGIHDQYEEGNYTTIFDESLQSMGFNSWFPGDPDGHTSYNCGYYYYQNGTRYGLRDGPCTTTYCFICEK